MRVTTREAARLLRIPEEALLRWIRSGDLPAHRSQEQYWLNDVELLEWASTRGAELDPSLASRWETAVPPSLGGALEAGGIHYAVPGRDREAVLAAVVERLPLPGEQDPEFVLQVLLAREALGSTGIGDGIAIPHVRNPLVLHVEVPTLALCFVERPIDFSAVDGKPVRVLFTLVSPTVRSHLHLMSRLGFALRDPRFRRVVADTARPEVIMDAAAEIDRALELADRSRKRGAAG